MQLDFKAKHKHADMSARKLRLFADLIRGRQADEALEMLRFLPNKGARLLEAVVKSAVANAENLKEERGLSFDVDDLYISTSRVDGGPIMKRIQPRARGTAYPIKRRYAHIHVTVSAEGEGPAQPQTQTQE